MAASMVVHPTADVLAESIAARLITRLADLQLGGRIPAVALTGGGVGIASLRAVAASPIRSTVDWSHVEFFWGDERFVPAADDDRNEKQAREALLDAIGAVPARIHAMAPSDGPFGDDVDAAAAAYAALLARRPDPLDIVLLGMGPEGHVASIFPDSPAVHADRSVVAVRDCPKPPPTRISLTLPTIRTAPEVWLLVAGAEKAEAVAAAWCGSREVAVPAAGAVGTHHTRWLVDRSAASAIPADSLP